MENQQQEKTAQEILGCESFFDQQIKQFQNIVFYSRVFLFYYDQENAVQIDLDFSQTSGIGIYYKNAGFLLIENTDEKIDEMLSKINEKNQQINFVCKLLTRSSDFPSWITNEFFQIFFDQQINIWKADEVSQQDAANKIWDVYSQLLILLSNTKDFSSSLSDEKVQLKIKNMLQEIKLEEKDFYLFLSEYSFELKEFLQLLETWDFEQFEEKVYPPEITITEQLDIIQGRIKTLRKNKEDEINAEKEN